MARRPTYKELLTLVQQQAKEITLLKEKLTQLKKELAELKHTKNSRNSSLAPSKDENRPKANQSLRKSSGNKPGGQIGRQGKTLEMVTTPDIIVPLQPDYCCDCGLSLAHLQAIKAQSRQIVDIPPIKAVFTEYQVFSKTCSCGCQTTADFPENVNTPISYGEHIEGLISYFHARQYLPFARMQEVFNDVFNINISEGGIHYLLNRFSDKVTPIYNIIKQRITDSAVIGADETGVKVNGEKDWFWTWQTPKLTFIAYAPNRKQETINSLFPNGFPNSTLVHDGWKPQLNTTAKNHQTCLAHLQRHLIYLNKLYPDNTWGHSFLKLLYQSLELKHKIKQPDYGVERAKIIQILERLIDNPPNKAYKKLWTFFKRIAREREQLFVFLFIEEVPPDNNASERAIRNVKVKQKISGQFKTEQAAQNFAKIRSVIDTTIKNGMNVLQALALIAKSETISTD